MAGAYAAKAGVSRGGDGTIDVLRSIGGVRGLAESILPGLVFLVVFTVAGSLGPALAGALGVAAVFTIVRLLQRGPATQAFSGLVGVAICAFVANTTGQSKVFFLWGFVTNPAYIVGMSVSVLVKWPLAGLLFGFVRGEGLDWRRDRHRLRLYNVATWILTAVLALRLVVQVPLYLADNVVALGTTRLVMGLPLYALGLWLAWLVSRPAGRASAGSGGPGTVPGPRSQD
ncbi:DUF3159 domain-containing protein [Arthrobacter deserti]|uniref:DUF3159 domain-containing protein n=1 Tax=Arthrobacter deserti TaxID=1742687 RepID=A0ABX1JQH3_9MICC|nr:DUF3159 domain-containing protein [Arthrobacter deserti]